MENRMLKFKKRLKKEFLQPFALKGENYEI